MSLPTARLIGAMALAAVNVSGCAVAVSGHSVLPSGPAGPQVSASHPESLLLSDEQVSAIIGKPGGLTTYETYAKMAEERDATYTLGDRACAGALWNTLDVTYRGSGYVAVAGRKVSEPGDEPEHDTDQGVVVFTTAQQAYRFLDRSMVLWQRCARQRVRFQVEGHKPHTWSVGVPAETGPDIVVRNSEEAGDGYVCQHAMRALGNVVIDAWVCGNDITEQGQAIVDGIADKVHA
ncbi:sensor domain-containing protein [Mycobacterium paraterrae]|uniref:Sensor domain-containing protein n=1 Tax=Mycobacterium paraterrae TaxID=577492 RepID=A0ABY3VUZ1_9MYCO|nr:sensor domain-containing protein [Mycobacterium paraterrae]UMB71013.1 sensor domain-containing protein [Mycobacterium paraterrae]